ncbi:hypothetical protein ACSS6W_008901 [Trichoderma asperelloides]
MRSVRLGASIVNFPLRHIVSRRTFGGSMHPSSRPHDSAPGVSSQVAMPVHAS